MFAFLFCKWCHFWVSLWFATIFLGGSLFQPTGSQHVRCVELPNNPECSDVLSEKYYAQNENFLTSESLKQINNAIDLIIGPCHMFIKIALCFYQYPPCDIHKAEILPICLTRCPELDDAYNKCTEGVNIPTIRNILPTLGPIILDFDCSNPDTYYGAVGLNISTTRCSNVTKLRLLATEDMNTESKESDDGLSASAIAAISIGCGLVVITGITAVLVFVKIRLNYRSKSPIATRDADLGHHNPLALHILNKKNSDGVEKKMSAVEIDEFLQYVKEKFSDLTIPTGSITKLDSLGKGAFGVVHKGEVLQADGSTLLVAIKTVKFVSSNSIRELVAEISIMKKLDHPNVLSLLGICVDTDDDDMLKMILPFMSNGDLRSYLKRNRVEPTTNTEQLTEHIDKATLIKMCIDIAKGMKYLVSTRFVHRDLAARNCMVDENRNIRVADFGLTKDIYTTEYYRGQKQGALPVKWMSPESILDNYFDEKTDWSYGVTCWEIFSFGRIPYPGIENHNIIIMLKAGKRLDKPVLCLEKLYTLMQVTWAENPSERPTFEEIVNICCKSILC